MIDHLDAFKNYSKNTIFQLSFLRELPSALRLDRFDGLIIHYSIAIGYLKNHYINPKTRMCIRNFQGLKAVFIQDEYRSVNSVLESLRYMKIHLLFTCVPRIEIEKVYSQKSLPSVTKTTTLTGYVPENLTKIDRVPIQNRSIHVGYRSRKPPFWLGQLGFEKHQIASSFKEKTRGAGLRLDVSCEEADRIYGKAWIRFVSSCKTMLGVESGSSVFDFKGNLQKKVELFIRKNPKTNFKLVQKKFLKPYENKIRLNQISPRCFEAAALGTAMILYEGKYSGILKPWRHFIPLKKDFSNINKILKIINQNNYLQKIADRAFSEIACNPKYSYKKFIQKFDFIINREFKKRKFKKAKICYSKKIFLVDILRSKEYVIHQVISRSLQKILLSTSIRKIIFRTWENIPFLIRSAVRSKLRVIGR